MATLASQPAPVKPSRARKPKQRTVCLLLRFGPTGRNAHLRITEDGKATNYLADRIPADWGEGYELAKFEADRRGDGDDVYHVLLNGEDGRDSCDCMGHERWGHCRHVEALKTLQAQGKLPALPESYRVGHDHGIPF
jgi:hypothetical protein